MVEKQAKLKDAQEHSNKVVHKETATFPAPEIDLVWSDAEREAPSAYLSSLSLTIQFLCFCGTKKPHVKCWGRPFTK
jgi:hypothetical protein